MLQFVAVCVWKRWVPTQVTFEAVEHGNPVIHNIQDDIEGGTWWAGMGLRYLDGNNNSKWILGVAGSRVERQRPGFKVRLIKLCVTK